MKKKSKPAKKTDKLTPGDTTDTGKAKGFKGFKPFAKKKK